MRFLFAENPPTYQELYPLLPPPEDGEVSQAGEAETDSGSPQEGEETVGLEVPSESESPVDGYEGIAELFDFEVPSEDDGATACLSDSAAEAQSGTSSRSLEPLYVKVGSGPDQPYNRDAVQYSQLVASPFYHGDEDLDAGNYILVSVAVPDICECRKRLDLLYLEWYERMRMLLA